MAQTQLFSELELRGVRLKNRVVASPMWQYLGEEGHPTDWHLMHLGRLANGGAGLVFQEGTTVERVGRGTLGDIGIWDDAFVPGLSRLTAAMRANGTTPGIQLMHAGRKARQKPPPEGRGPLERRPEIPDWDAWTPSGPSAVSLAPGEVPPREMSLADIQFTIESFAAAAGRALRCGYEVVELHAAHGYLLHSFLCEATNRRTDAYGGSFEKRARLLVDTVDAVRELWPDDKPLFVRLSCIDPSGWTMEDTVALTRLLMAHGVDAIDCTSGGLAGSPLPSGVSATYGYQAGYAEHLRRETGVRTMAVGLIVHAAHAERLLQDGAADLVAIGRELLYNPNWAIDAAQKLGAEVGFAVSDPRTAHWLSRRAQTVPGLTPSTFG